MTKYSKVYLKKDHHKRGIKLGEVKSGSTWLEMLEEIPRLKKLTITPYIRMWYRDDRTQCIDYGAHNAIITVKE
ncbi:hypothetical protein C7J88_09635 [Staphylococcus muscae]|uniref:Uncharacterized protein n=1 Tax=Staphylococcus muscae TaxID=1294 RepID=A0A240C052_9STAP|nr:hypothetical protein C7J88_09635 [Staphylococcus muscae]PNZ03557.1 hypothetical protein CD131_06085 [Staphylococcus muscae]GGA93303.1 hypothetical protein GCM10007183_16870 [Staphylococcus muscae]SNW00673.1 Uncharacterised protein [Staphylococcus muscae]